MIYTQEQMDAVRAENERQMTAELDLKIELRKVLNSPKYNCLNNELKAGVLLELENDGEYDPEG